MKKIAILFCLLLFAQFQLVYAQELTVTGVVISADDDFPMPGVNVIVKDGGGVGTITDFDGNYSINVKSGTTLVFSFIGCKSIEKKITSSAPLNITLESDAIMLNEVVAVGYGVMKKSDLTGAVSSVKGKDLQKSAAAGLDQALQGQAAGVTVNANSGQPGEAAQVRIRGIGTVNDSNPIYVVDGVIVSDITFLSPTDIESTEILKDASSTAIYGSRGANGVILVTTKKGGDSNGKTNITFNGYVGVQSAANRLSLMGSEEFAETIIYMKNLASEVSYYEKNGFSKWLSAYRLGSSTYYPSNLDYSTIDTDWQDEVFRNAMIQNYSISFDGGNKDNAYSISASYFSQEGTIIGSYYDRFTLRANSSHQVREWLKVGENLSFAYSDSRFAMNNSSSPGASVLSAAIAMAPWDPTHYPDGSVNSNGDDLSGQISASSNFKNVTNPFSMVENTYPEDITERWVGDVYLEITPVKGLSLRSDVSLDLANARSRTYKAAYEYSSYDQMLNNYLSSSMSRSATWMVENIANYMVDWGKNSLSVMLGNTIEEYNYYYMGGSGASILSPSENNWYLSQTTENKTESSDSADRTRMTSYLSRLHYSYSDRYLATFNFRADGSNKFPENMWGYFPSTALAWRVSEEPFMQDVRNLDYLKLRAGWGQIGNDKIGNDSFTLNVFNEGPSFVDYSFNGELVSGATILTYINNGGKWETTEQWNVGVDFGLFDNLLSGTVDGFVRDTYDMLMSVTAPAQVGNRYSALANVGTVRNQGIEIQLNHQNTIGEVGYNISGNVSFISNELTELNGGSTIYGDKTICDEGYALYTFWAYEYAGIYQTDEEAQEYLYGYTSDEIAYHAGDAKYVDQNGDGLINDDDKTDLGNPFPWLTYGLNMSANWKNFDLQLFFQGVYGNEIYNAVRHRTEWDGTEATLSTTMRDVWTTTNTDGTIPNPYGTSNNNAESSRFIEDGSYLRLKNVQLGYTVPKAAIQKVGLSSCRLYVSASNLFTLTDYTGYDPEVSGGVDYGNYPQSRTFMVGTTINF